MGKLNKVNMVINYFDSTYIKNRYIYKDFLAIVWLQARAKIVDYYKA